MGSVYRTNINLRNTINMKTHWKKLVNPDYLGAYSLDEGKDMTVKIINVVRENVKGEGGRSEECTVAHLEGHKPFILNRTNCKTITKIYGTPYIEDWAGKQITVFQAITKLKGEDVECLRIRPVAPEKPEFTPDHKKWNGAVKAIREGNATISDITKSFKLSKENEKLLLDEI